MGNTPSKNGELKRLHEKIYEQLNATGLLDRIQKLYGTPQYDYMYELLQSETSLSHVDITMFLQVIIPGRLGKDGFFQLAGKKKQFDFANEDELFVVVVDEKDKIQYQTYIDINSELLDKHAVLLQKLEGVADTKTGGKGKKCKRRM